MKRSASLFFATIAIGLLLAGCDRRAAGVVNTALGATNVTFTTYFPGPSKDPIVLTPKQRQAMDRLLEKFLDKKECRTESESDSSPAPMGIFAFDDIRVFCYSSRLYISAPAGTPRYSVEDAALEDMTEAYTTCLLSEKPSHTPTREEWSNILEKLN